MLCHHAEVAKDFQHCSTDYPSDCVHRFVYALITNLRAKKSAVSSCWSIQGFPVIRYTLCFLQCDCWRGVSLQRVININEVQWIGRTSPDPLLLWMGSRLCTVDIFFHYIGTVVTYRALMQACSSQASTSLSVCGIWYGQYSSTCFPLLLIKLFHILGTGN